MAAHRARPSHAQGRGSHAGGGQATRLLEQDIPDEQIAVATGSQKELGGIKLDTACPIRYVITVEALKEGRDCSFAYVVSRLQSVSSPVIFRCSAVDT